MKRISIISGGTSGLGLEIAELLLRSGKNVLVLGRSIDKIDSASRRLRNISGSTSAESLICNIGSEEDVDRLANSWKTTRIQ